MKKNLSREKKNLLLFDIYSPIIYYLSRGITLKLLKYSFLLLFLFSCSKSDEKENLTKSQHEITNQISDRKSITLVYKNSGKPPYMERFPDNSGLYYDMVKEIADEIGYDLKVRRGPKKRVAIWLESGEADIYASTGFVLERSKYLFYIQNGLFRHEEYLGLTTLDIPQLSSLKELNDYNLSWAIEAGCTQALVAKSLNIKYIELDEISMQRIVPLLEAKRPFFFKIMNSKVKEYLKAQNIDSLAEIGIRAHTSLCKPKNQKLFLCVSRDSPYYKEEPNPSFNPNHPICPNNFPVKLVPETLYYKIKIAMEKLIKTGEIERLKKKYGVK